MIIKIYKSNKYQRNNRSFAVKNAIFFSYLNRLDALIYPCVRIPNRLLGRRNGLYKTKQLLCISYIRQAELAVGCTQFQTVTTCNRLVAFLY